MQQRRYEIYALFILIGSLCVLMLSGLSIIGYAIGVDQFHTWTGNSGMGINTAICFVLISSVTLTIGWVMYGREVINGQTGKAD